MHTGYAYETQINDHTITTSVVEGQLIDIGFIEELTNLVYEVGYTDGYKDGYDDGFQDGYSQGFSDGVNSVKDAVN